MIACPFTVKDDGWPGKETIGVYDAVVLTCTKMSTLPPVQEGGAAPQAVPVQSPEPSGHCSKYFDEAVRLVSCGASCCAACSIPALSAALTGLCDPYCAAAPQGNCAGAYCEITIWDVLLMLIVLEPQNGIPSGKA